MISNSLKFLAVLTTFALIAGTFVFSVLKTSSSKQDETYDNRLSFYTSLQKKGLPRFLSNIDVLKKSDLWPQTPKFFLHFWASWCDSCVEEFTELDQLFHKNSTWLMLAISEDDTKQDMKKFLADFSFSKNIIFIFDDKKSWASRFFVNSLPETFVFSRPFSESSTLSLQQRFVGSQKWLDLNL